MSVIPRIETAYGHAAYVHKYLFCIVNLSAKNKVTGVFE